MRSSGMPLVLVAALAGSSSVAAQTHADHARASAPTPKPPISPGR